MEEEDGWNYVHFSKNPENRKREEKKEQLSWIQEQYKDMMGKMYDLFV